MDIRKLIDSVDVAGLKQPFSKRNMRMLAPFFIVVLSVLLISFMVKIGPRALPKAHDAKLPGVKIQTVRLGDASIPVYTRGVINPVIQIQLMSEVNGTVIEATPALSTGAFFHKGDILLRVDPSHHALELANARANLATAEHAYARTEAGVRSSGVDVDASRKTKLARGTYQLDEARAHLEVARRAVQLAEAQMTKTTIRAPFDGRVAKKMVDTNEALTLGRPIAQIYSTDNAEVRLPLSAEQIELVDVPLQYENQAGSTYEPLVILEDVTAKYRWTGRVKRSEGFINPTNRLTYLIAIVRQPYARDPAQPNRPPLAAGTFVEATIQGSTHKNTATLPLDALHNMNEVWVLDAKKHLRFRKVDVLYRGRDRVYISGGLGDGEKVILTPLEVAAENMELAVIAEVPQLPPVLDDNILRLGNQALSSSTAAAAPDVSAPAASAPAATTLPPSQPTPAAGGKATAKTPAPSIPPGATPPGAEGMTGMPGTDQEAEI